MALWFEQLTWGIVGAAAGSLLLLLLYLRRRRPQTRRVSALFLWPQQLLAHKSGRQTAWRRLPLSFYLELAALLLLALAMGLPMLRRSMASCPCVVVLDNSYSMQAGQPSAKVQAMEWLRKRLRADGRDRVLWILAGRRPRLLDDTRNGVLPSALESRWSADEGAFAWMAATQMARSLLPGGEVWVVTDTPHEGTLPRDVGWMAFGSPMDNLAIVNGRRQGRRLSVELFNGGVEPKVCRLSVNGGVAMEETLPPKETLCHSVELPAEMAQVPCNVELMDNEDALAYDDALTLLPEGRAPLRYAMDRSLGQIARELAAKAIVDNPNWMADETSPELVIGTEVTDEGPWHRLIWHRVGDQTARLFAEPITIQGDVQVLKGADVAELSWPLNPELNLPGQIWLRQGETSLMTCRRRGAFMDVHLNLHYRAGNLPRQPFWPVFFWNLGTVLTAERQGCPRTNWREDEMVTCQMDASSGEPVWLDGPDGSHRRLFCMNRDLPLGHLSPGCYDLLQGHGRWSFAVFSHNGAESNLAKLGREETRPTVAGAVGDRVQELAALGFAAALLLMMMNNRFQS